jgi:hypothetical protein
VNSRARRRWMAEPYSRGRGKPDSVGCSDGAVGAAVRRGVDLFDGAFDAELMAELEALFPDEAAVVAPTVDPREQGQRYDARMQSTLGKGGASASRGASSSGASGSGAADVVDPTHSSHDRGKRCRGSVGAAAPLGALSVSPLSFNDVRLAGKARVSRYSVRAEEGVVAVPGILSEGTWLQRVVTEGDGACALHAAFGGLHNSLPFSCPDARVRAANALESLAASAATERTGSNLSQRFPAFVNVKAQFWDLALAACRSDHNEGRECGLLWDAYPVGVQQDVRDAQAVYEQALANQEATMARFEELSKLICVASPHGRELVQRIALEVHGLDVTHVPDVLERFCDADLHDWLGPAFDCLGDKVIVKGTAAKPVAFPADGPANKYVALFDARPVFDYFRRAFFITGCRPKQIQIIDILCQSQDVRDDRDVCSLLDTLLAESQNLAASPDAFAGFDIVAVRAFARACLDSRYWFSFDEVLFLAEVLGEAVVVVELFEDRVARCVGSSVRPAGKPVAVIGVDSNRVRRVRSHFSRLVVVPEDHVDARPVFEQRGGLLKRRRCGRAGRGRG